ncbi:hypothetical protein A8F94_16050 [Bacillus sp. FJAT-27225]|uniref:alpha/beta hydrolase n=1 Tax=Bacillus sp. FJAT-27225 TaxID=1743144 RepID=UPI00080C2FD8|nr:esterase family protein [Bacillus sp. FJAT-27225]OCA84228.1 hypothetical protein A8F94_16050 [Bacillus sp. FJAT-27225]
MEYPRGTVQDLVIKSAALGEDVQILVHLPASFSHLYKYSLLIVQDGHDYFRLGRIGRMADELLAKKEIENLIIVGIPYKNVEDRRSKYHPDGEKNSAYIRFLAHELVPYLDREFPTLQMGSTRALGGDSLAGTVSLMAALAYPHTFGKVMMQSPYVNDRVLQAAKEFNDQFTLDIYHTIGQEEDKAKLPNGRIADFLTPNRELTAALSGRSINHMYKEIDGGHAWTYWQPGIRDGLRSLF